MWKMLLRKASRQGEQGRDEFNDRCLRFERGEWNFLLASARQASIQNRTHPRRILNEEEIQSAKLEKAVARVRAG